MLADVPPPAPPAVAAFEVDSLVEVSWLPPDATVDSYNVYGVTSGGAFVLLGQSTSVADVDVMAMTVASGYPAYAVSSVSGGVESEASVTPAVPCVKASTSPPDVSPSDCRVVVLVPRE